MALSGVTDENLLFVANRLFFRGAITYDALVDVAVGVVEDDCALEHFLFFFRACGIPLLLLEHC